MTVTVQLLDGTGKTIENVVSIDSTPKRYLLTTNNGVKIFQKKVVQIIFVENL